MKIAQSLLSIFLGGVIAWVILIIAPPPKKSTFALAPWPLDEPDNENLALIGVGLVSRQSQPSVMDATAPPNDVIMMKTESTRDTQPEVIHVVPSPASVVASSPVAAPPTTMMPPAMTPAPMSTLGLSPMSTQSPSPSA
jgi:hypothetical protein